MSSYIASSVARTTLLGSLFLHRAPARAPWYRRVLSLGVTWRLDDMLRRRTWFLPRTPMRGGYGGML